MTHASLFSGIGGFDLAAEWMGWENVFHCEYDPFCQKVLKHHFPNSKLYEDVRTFDATDYAGRIDLLSGGFPCQPFSNAGLKQGTEDERHLWPSMLRIIREVSPKYVVGENVRGLLNWSGGLVFEQVCIDLEDAGYEVTPYLLPASAKNAPHRRDRIWFIAYAPDSPCVRGGEDDRQSKRTHTKRNTVSSSGSITDTLREGHQRSELDGTFNKGFGSLKSPRPIAEHGKTRSIADPCSKRPKSREEGQRPKRREQPNDEQPEGRNEFPRADFEMFPTQPPICGGDDGLPEELDGITFSKWRKESIKAFGNAIVPQVAHEIFKAIQKMENTPDQ